MKHLAFAILVSAAFVTGCESTNTSPPLVPQAGTGAPADLASFVGARAGQAELGLNNLGYQLARTEGLTAFWWNGATQTCARIVTSDGRFQTIDTAAPGACSG